MSHRSIILPTTLALFAAAGLTVLAQSGTPCVGGDCEAVNRGMKAFLNPAPVELGGNGRACADCHAPAHHFQLSPATVEARYQFLQLRKQLDPSADDPLFRSIDADDHAEDYSTLRQHALIRVRMKLPANVKLIDPLTNQPSAETHVDLWRAVPPINAVLLTAADTVNPWARGPHPLGGYQWDGRFGTLQEQAQGALIDHAAILEPDSLGRRARLRGALSGARGHEVAKTTPGAPETCDTVSSP